MRRGREGGVLCVNIKGTVDDTTKREDVINDILPLSYHVLLSFAPYYSLIGVGSPSRTTLHYGDNQS